MLKEIKIARYAGPRICREDRDHAILKTMKNKHIKHDSVPTVRLSIHSFLTAITEGDPTKPAFSRNKNHLTKPKTTNNPNFVFNGKPDRRKGGRGERGGGGKLYL